MYKVISNDPNFSPYLPDGLGGTIRVTTEGVVAPMSDELRRLASSNQLSYSFAEYEVLATPAPPEVIVVPEVIEPAIPDEPEPAILEVPEVSEPVIEDPEPDTPPPMLPIASRRR